MRDTSDGWLASRVLKAMKNTSNSASNQIQLACGCDVTNHMPICTINSNAIAPTKTCFDLPCFSLMKIGGNISTNEISTTGRYTFQCSASGILPSRINADG